MYTYMYIHVNIFVKYRYVDVNRCENAYIYILIYLFIYHSVCVHVVYVNMPRYMFLNVRKYMNIYLCKCTEIGSI